MTIPLMIIWGLLINAKSGFFNHTQAFIPNILNLSIFAALRHCNMLTTLKIQLGRKITFCGLEQKINFLNLVCDLWLTTCLFIPLEISDSGYLWGQGAFCPSLTVGQDGAAGEHQQLCALRQQDLKQQELPVERLARNDKRGWKMQKEKILSLQFFLTTLLLPGTWTPEPEIPPKICCSHMK